MRDASGSRHGALPVRRTSSRALPLVAHVLEELWRRRHAGRITRKHYDALGGIERALTRSADALLRGLDETSRVAVDNLLLGLVAPSGASASGFTRKTLAVDEAVRLAGGGDAGRQVLALLSGGGPAREMGDCGGTATPTVRLVATRESGGVVQVDLVHEALLHAWEHMVALLEQRGIERIQTHDLEREAARWEEHEQAEAWLPRGIRLEALLQAAPESDLGREYSTALRDHRVSLVTVEQRRMWLRRIVFVGVVVVALIFGVVGFIAVSRGQALEVERDNVAAERDNVAAERDKAQMRLDQAIKLTRTILWDVLPKLKSHPEVRAEAKEILDLLQQMLRELGISEEDRDARWETMAAHNKRGDEALHTDNLDRARDEYARGLVIAEELAKADPDSSRVKRDLGVSLNKLGDVEVQAGNLSAARELFSRSLSISEKLAKADPGSADAKRGLSISFERLGEVEVAAGNLSAARDLLSSAITIAEELANADPGSADAKRGLSISFEKLGLVELAEGNLSAARDLFSHCFEIRTELAKADPDSVEAKRDLAIALHKLGDVEVQAGKYSAARDVFSRSLTMMEELAKADPDSAEAKRDLSTLLQRLGLVEVEAGNYSAARDLFFRFRAIAEELAKADPDSALAKRYFLISLITQGDVEVAAGNHSAARDVFSRSLSMTEDLAKANPGSAEAQRDLCAALERLGEVEVEAGNLSAARDLFSRFLAVAEELAKADPDSGQASFDVVESHLRFVQIAEADNDVAELQEHLSAADERLDAMAARGQLEGYAKREGVRELVNERLDALSSE